MLTLTSHGSRYIAHRMYGDSSNSSGFCTPPNISYSREIRHGSPARALFLVDPTSGNFCSDSHPEMGIQWVKQVSYIIMMLLLPLLFINNIYQRIIISIGISISIRSNINVITLPVLLSM